MELVDEGTLDFSFIECLRYN